MQPTNPNKHIPEHSTTPNPPAKDDKCPVNAITADSFATTELASKRQPEDTVFGRVSKHLKNTLKPTSKKTDKASGKIYGSCRPQRISYRQAMRDTPSEFKILHFAEKDGKTIIKAVPCNSYFLDEMQKNSHNFALLHAEKTIICPHSRKEHAHVIHNHEIEFHEDIPLELQVKMKKACGDSEIQIIFVTDEEWSELNDILKTSLIKENKAEDIKEKNNIEKDSFFSEVRNGGVSNEKDQKTNKTELKNPISNKSKNEEGNTTIFQKQDKDIELARKAIHEKEKLNKYREIKKRAEEKQERRLEDANQDALTRDKNIEIRNSE